MFNSFYRIWPYSAIIFSMLMTLCIWYIASKSFSPIDYYAWRNDSSLFLDYLNADSSDKINQLSKFPLGYLLNSFLFGSNYKNILWLNLGILLLPVALVVLLNGPRIAATSCSVYIAALLLSPLPTYYIYSGALEIQSGVINGIFMYALVMVAFPIQKTPRTAHLTLLVLSGFFLPLYKDTTALVFGVSFLLLTVLRAITPSTFTSFSALSKYSTYRVLWFGGLPVVLGILTTLGYNLLKYGKPLPVVYFSEANKTAPDILKSIEFLIGSVFSLNGGVVVFWFLPFFLAITGWRLLGLRLNISVVWFGTIIALITCLGLSRWWAPFGWDSWGNRLMLQPMLALIVGMLMSLSHHPIRVYSTTKVLSVVLLATPTLFWSSYYVLIPHLSPDFNVTLADSLNPGPACSTMYKILPFEVKREGIEFWKSETYYLCARERMLHVPSPLGAR